LRIKRYVQKEVELKGVYLLAANANRGTDGVNILDALRIKRYVQKEITINQK